MRLPPIPINWSGLRTARRLGDGNRPNRDKLTKTPHRWICQPALVHASWGSSSRGVPAPGRIVELKGLSEF